MPLENFGLTTMGEHDIEPLEAEDFKGAEDSSSEAKREDKEKSEPRREHTQRQKEKPKQERLLTAEELSRMNYYERLGVAENATLEEIRKNFRELSTRYHPDTGGGDDIAYRYISEAYTTLKDPAKRERYDKLLRYERAKAKTRTETNAGKSSSKGGSSSTGTSGSSSDYEEPNSTYSADKEPGADTGPKVYTNEKHKKKTYTSSSNYSDSSYGSSGSASKSPEPPKPASKKDRDKGFFATFFSGLWKGIGNLFSGIDPAK